MYYPFPLWFIAATTTIFQPSKSLKHKIISIDLPIALGILTLFVQSAYDIISGTGIGYSLTPLTGLVFFLLIGKWQLWENLPGPFFERDYKSYFPSFVTKLEDGKETDPVGNKGEGDIISLCAIRN
ncbi:MAG: hypothetical protein R2759_00225 [Bacteroidales bacterium]